MSSGKDTAYLVKLTPRASRDVQAIYEYVGAEQTAAAAEWYNRLEHLIYTLDRLPDRGAHVAEDPTLRQLLHGNKPHVYRIIYSIEHFANRVIVLHIRHGARRPFRPQGIR